MAEKNPSAQQQVVQRHVAFAPPKDADEVVTIESRNDRADAFVEPESFGSDVVEAEGGGRDTTQSESVRRPGVGRWAYVHECKGIVQQTEPGEQERPAAGVSTSRAQQSGTGPRHPNEALGGPARWIISRRCSGAQTERL